MKMQKISLTHVLKKFFLVLLALFALTGCSEDSSIVNNVDEREANEIIVFLASKGIKAHKVTAQSGGAGGGKEASNLWNINVGEERSIEAMSILNYNGLPRRKGPSLLDLFAKEGLMTSDREEKVRYQSGLEEELKNVIRKIDGIIDADVQISFPKTETIVTPDAEQAKIKAAVYVKHQGIFDDPNTHLESKIKRLLAGSIDGLDYENVSVISDRSRFTDIFLQPDTELIAPKGKEKEYVSIWSVVMMKKSSFRFRIIFFLLIVIILIFGSVIGFLIYKFYPQIQNIRRAKNTENADVEETPPEPKI